MVQGFIIPFREDPEQVHIPQPSQYTREQMDLLSMEVTSLLRKGAVVPVEPTVLEEGFYSTLFLVPKKKGQSTA